MRSIFSLLCKRYESLFCARMLPGAPSVDKSEMPLRALSLTVSVCW